MIINTNSIKVLIFFLTSLILSSCGPKESPLSQHQLYVFGTLVELSIWHPDPETTQNTVNEICAKFNQMHHHWHAWKPGRLQQINQQLRNGDSVELTPEEAHFVARTIALSRQSSHHFNPTIGALINLWGFHSDEYPLLTPPPDEAAIESLAQLNITVDDLTLNGTTLSSMQAEMWLDFGGIAKGYAVDLALDILQQHGINHAIVNAGGDLRVLGNKGGDAWQVAIQSPADWSLLGSLKLASGEAAFTSGNYQRYKEFDGQRYAHIIDPTSGWPVAEIVSATVVATDGITADAAATALVVAGSQHWPDVAKQMGIQYALVIDDSHHCSATPAMLDRLKNLQIACDSDD